MEYQGWAPLSATPTSAMVRKIANGSLVADSISSVAPTRGRSRSPREWMSRNTAAASVEEMTAPTRSDCTQSKPRR